MKRYYDKALVKTYIGQLDVGPETGPLQEHMFIARYGKGEFVTMPSENDNLFQIVVSGSLKIYAIRNDGSLYFLANGQEGYILGDMEIFSEHSGNVYAEANTDLTCLALTISKNRSAMLENSLFLQMVCRSLTRKMELITTMDATPAGLKQRVEVYMRYKCPDGEIIGLQKAAFQMNCSMRQLQRILNRCIAEKIVVKTGKGSYKLVSYNMKEPGM